MADGIGGDLQIELDVRLRQVIAGREPGLEQQPGTCGLGDRDPLDLDSYMPGAGQDVHPGVRVARVGEDLLVLLEPGVHRVPVEADHVAQLFDRQSWYRS